MAEKRLFLLDGMALVYRAHFALIRSPIFTSGGLNTSAILGFTNTLLDIRNKWKPTHMAVVFDTSAPTERHKEFADYKAKREEMPEDLSAALPYVDRVIEAFNIPIIRADGFEADDIIGTLACRASREDFNVLMVTPDKDFGQLVGDKVKIFKPGRMGSETEILGVEEIKARWGIERIEQVTDILGLMGDSIDNIPGIPGIGEKTAAKLIGQFGTIENLLASTAQLKGKQKELIETHAESARLSKRLATIDTAVPVTIDWQALEVREPNESLLKPLFVELEFNALGRRLFGADFKAGRGYEPVAGGVEIQGDLFETGAATRSFADTAHRYEMLSSPDAVAQTLARLAAGQKFGIALDRNAGPVKAAGIRGVAVSGAAGEAFYFPADPQYLSILQPYLSDAKICKAGADLKGDLTALRWRDIRGADCLFDLPIAHSLVDPESRHAFPYLAERYLGYQVLGENGEGAQRALEAADLALQLMPKLEQGLHERGQQRVFYEIEAPLIPVLVEMEHSGVAIDTNALREYSTELSKQIADLEGRIFAMAGEQFNLGSPKQLGRILFDVMKLGEKPKKTRTGQYSTNEQVLDLLASKHEIARLILEHREMTKLKSTYVDALPGAVDRRSGRIHTTYYQASTSTGRLASMDPNLQNIPIRSERGREIRKAFVPGVPGFSFLAADYSQIELRIMAEISKDEGMRQAFADGTDIHTATAAKVYNVPLDAVTFDMRRTAKMVNFGIIYGISSFGLAQRLGIPRQEAGGIIQQYFEKYPGVKRYMQETVNFARQSGYVETITGRRRYVRDVTSQNATVRQAAERNAINMPIQGTAADMIKIAMVRIQEKLRALGARTRMLLQVHDELVFELCDAERETVVPAIAECMRNAIQMEVPIAVETGVGKNWMEAH